MSSYNAAYEARLVDVICVDCGTKCRHQRHEIARGKVTRCRACMNVHRGNLVRARTDPANMLEVPCAVCEKAVKRQRGRIERAKLAVTCSRSCCNEARRRGLIKSTKPAPSGPTHAQWEGLHGTVVWYGANWKAQRDAAKLRDRHTCQDCGLTQMAYGRALEVHHVVRFLDFDTPEDANVLSNLRTLCRPCHRKADAVLYYARKASGVRAVYRERPGPQARRRRKFSNFGDLVSLLARNWRVRSHSEDFEGERSQGIVNAIACATKKPSKSRDLCAAPDRCQVTTLMRANAEIEANCWLFTLQGETEPDPRLFEVLLEVGDHKRIASAQRIAFLDWEDSEMRGAREWTDQRISTCGARGIGPRLPSAWRRLWPQIDNCVLPGGTHIRA